MLNNSQNNKLQNKNIARILIVAILIVPSVLFADGHHHYSGHHSRHVEFARVVRVDPIYRIVRVSPRHSHEHRHSWHAENRYSADSNFAQPVILGAVVGGLIGNELGNDYNRGLTTATGAIIGSAIVSDAFTPRYSRHRNYNYKELVGYRVCYRYRGRYHTTQMDHRPGARIALRSVSH